MQRKPGFPVANCNIKVPDSVPTESVVLEEDSEQQQRRQQLINFGHSQWGFNNWSWSVTKQELDFVDFANGKYSAGVVAFVSVHVKSFNIHRENIGYATSLASMKGLAIYRSRKCAVTNALKETLLSFGGTVTAELLELLESQKHDLNNQTAPARDVLPENNQNLANKPPATNATEPKNAVNHGSRNTRKDSSDSSSSRDNSAVNIRTPHSITTASATGPPLVAKAHPMPINQMPAAKHVLPANQPRHPAPPPQAPLAPSHPRPNSNEPVNCDMVANAVAVIPSVTVPTGGISSNLSEAEARAERKRRQKLAQEQFRQRHLTKEPSDGADAVEEELDPHSIDCLLLEIPSQVPTQKGSNNAKRKSLEITDDAKRPALTSLKVDI